MHALSKHLVHFAIIAIGSLGMASTLFAQEKVVPSQSHEAKQEHNAMNAEKKIAEALAKLSAKDRELATAQRFCAVMEYGRLGAMGTPIKLMLEGKPVFVCCKGCVKSGSENVKSTLTQAQKLVAASRELAKLSPDDRATAESQKYCPIAADSLLGGMGSPIRLDIGGKPVFVCCKGCVAKAQADPSSTLAKVEELRRAGMEDE